MAFVEIHGTVNVLCLPVFCHSAARKKRLSDLALYTLVVIFSISFFSPQRAVDRKVDSSSANPAHTLSTTL